MSPLFDDSEDDVTLPRRGAGSSAAPVRSARELDREPADREYTLNTGIVLALFFALALLCAVFFGFGYSIGHKSAPAAPAAASDSTGPIGAPVTDNTASAKPSSGTVAVPEYVPSASAVTAPSHPPTIATVPPRQNAATNATAAEAVSRPAPVVRVPAPAADVPAPITPAGGTTYVQVAAVSHQEDADVLLSSLRRRGYTVLTRNDPNDHLIHVQIGPFPTRKDADAMRQKLLGDGYNAILK
jgi:DedD protein